MLFRIAHYTFHTVAYVLRDYRRIEETTAELKRHSRTKKDRGQKDIPEQKKIEVKNHSRTKKDRGQKSFRNKKGSRSKNTAELKTTA